MGNGAYDEVVRSLEVTVMAFLNPYLETGEDERAFTTYRQLAKHLLDAFPEVWDMLPVETARVLEEVKQLGADDCWFCAYCGQKNPDGAGHCTYCQSPKKECEEE